jgi:hypothetical protein
MEDRSGQHQRRPAGTQDLELRDHLNARASLQVAVESIQKIDDDLNPNEQHEAKAQDFEGFEQNVAVQKARAQLRTANRRHLYACRSVAGCT